ncbi:hypothetical protein HY213_00120 [Candidatus Peregrinibacteria bacterium]|nr:hypothetical protein [Candidatus Peregrinibacteria bacterium]
MRRIHQTLFVITVALLLVACQKADQATLEHDREVATMRARLLADVTAIVDATYAYRTAHHDHLPFALTTNGKPLEICKAASKNCPRMVRIDALVPAYLAGIPVNLLADPAKPGTGYAIKRAANGTVTVLTLLQP